MLYHLPPPIGIIVLFLPLMIHRKQLYDEWANKERAQGRRPRMSLFLIRPERWQELPIYFRDRKNLALALIWLTLMFFPFEWAKTVIAGQ